MLMDNDTPAHAGKGLTGFVTKVPQQDQEGEPGQ